MRQPVLRLGAPRDPLMEFMMNPMAPPPMMDMPSMLDDMMNHAVMMAREQPQFVTVHFMSLEDAPLEKPQEQPKEQATPEQVLDSMVHALMQRSSEEPEVVAKKIAEHGNKLLQSAPDTDDDSDRVSMARRLTQVSPDMDHSRPLPLPFGCRRNRCLMSAYDQAAVSPSCSDALRAAEDVRTQIVTRKALAVERESEVFLHFTMIYVVLAVVTLMVLRKHLHRIGRRMHAHMEMKRKILQAVYSDPAIKAKVEGAVGGSIGAVPPLPPHVLAQMGGHAFPHRGFFCFRMLKCVVFASILTLVFVNPLLAMPLLCILMFARFLHLSFCPPKPPQLMCSCCCCGLSTDDVVNGNVSSKQACCTCCNGMGVCAPGCADCCGLEPDGSCDCCADGCDCCNPPPACCCCDATAKSGILTTKQMNCSCCKGSGTCGKGCKACCGDETGCDCCGDGCDCCTGDSKRLLKECRGSCGAGDYKPPVCDKPVQQRTADKDVYQGIPIQVV